MNTLLNGQPADALNLSDRGLQYGDGLFETIAVHGGEPARWDAHMARLAEGCRRLGLPLPPMQTLHEEALGLCRDEERAVLKLIWTRGSGGRGYRPPPDPRPTRILSLHPWPDHPAAYAERGIEACICQTRLPNDPLLAGVKHLNRLHQVLARGEWQDEYQEGVMLDTQGQVVEGTMSNLFILDGQGFSTPDLSTAGVAGITRARLIEHLEDCKIRPIMIEELHQARAVFFCNTIIGIWPVNRLAGQPLNRDQATEDRLQALREVLSC